VPKPWTTVFPRPAHWDERFSAPGYFYGAEPNDFLRSAADRFRPGSEILSLAEGEGRNAVFLASLGHRVTAVDSSMPGLRKAEALAARRGVSIATVHADLATFPIQPASWDGVVAIFCHLPPEIRGAVHRRAVAGLRPGGVLVLEAYTPAQLAHGTGGPQVEELLIRLDQLREELSGLEFEIAREVERDIHEGRGHTGRSAVVQILGVRPGTASAGAA
jgi:SAM-dependent methyltransferase